MSRKQFDYKNFNRIKSTNKNIDEELNKIWSVIRQIWIEDHIYDIPNQDSIEDTLPEFIPERFLCKDNTGLYLKTKNGVIKLITENDMLQYMRDVLSYTFNTNNARPRIEYGTAEAGEVVFFNKSYRRLLTIVTPSHVKYQNITGFIMGESSGNWIALGED